MRKRRGRGEDGIYQRDSDGLWVASMSLGYDGAGKRIRRVVYGATKREARAKLDAGLTQPSARVTENQWRAAGVRLRDSVVACRACQAENFHDPDGPAAASACWRCRATVPAPFRLQVGKHDVALDLDTLVHPHHLDPQRPYDFSVPSASIARHPAAPDQWGLKNLGTVSWSFTPVGGTAAAAAPGRSVPLAHGTRINFGGCEGEIRRGQ